MSVDSIQHYQKIRVAAEAKAELLAKKDGGQDAFYQLFADMQKVDYSASAKLPKADAPRHETAVAARPDKKECARPNEKTDRTCNDDKRVEKDDDRADDDDMVVAEAKTEKPDDKDEADTSEKKADASEAKETTVAKAPEAKDAKEVGTEFQLAAEPVTNDTTTVEAADPFSDMVVEADMQQTGDAKPAQTPVTITVPQQAMVKPEQQQATGGEGEKQQVTQEAEAITISFRPDTAKHADTPGASAGHELSVQPERPAQPATPEVKTEAKDAKAGTPTEVKPELKELATAGQHHANQHDQSQQQQQPQQHVSEAPVQADAAPQPKKEAKSDAKVENTFAAALGNDETHPTAGIRASASPISTPVPSSNVLPGGGSSLSQQHAAVKGDASLTAGITNIASAAQTTAPAATPVMTVVRGKDGAPNLMPSEQVAIQMHRMAKAGADKFEIQLHPADMGRVDVSLQIDKDGLVRAVVTADNQQTFDMMQKDSRSLERALQQAGLQTDSGSLSFNLRGGNREQQQAGDQQGANTPSWMKKENAAAEEAVEIVQYRAANGRVDMRV